MVKTRSRGATAKARAKEENEKTKKGGRTKTLGINRTKVKDKRTSQGNMKKSTKKEPKRITTKRAGPGQKRGRGVKKQRDQRKTKVVMREIDRMMGKAGTDEEASTSTSTAGMITRHARQAILTAKRIKVECDETRNAESVVENVVDLKAAPEEPMEKEKIKDEGFSTRGVYRMVMSDDPATQLDGIKRTRKLISYGSDLKKPIDTLLKMRFLPRIVEFLQVKDNSQLQYEAAWIITNIASGTTKHTRTVVKAGVVPILFEFLQSPVEELQEQAIWALGNIAGDNEEHRDVVINSGILNQLFPLSELDRIQMTRHVAWVISNLCRGKNPPPKAQEVSSCLELISELLQHSDFDVLVCACYALVNLTDEPTDLIKGIDKDIVSRLVNLLNDYTTRVRVGALRAICNLVTHGSAKQKELILKSSVLPNLQQFFIDHRPLLKEAYRIVASFMAGTKPQIQAVIDEGLIPNVMRQFEELDLETRKEITLAFASLASKGRPEQIRYIVSQGCIEKLCQFLIANENTTTVQAVLDGLKCILKLGEQDARAAGTTNSYTGEVEECAGYDKLEALQHHDNKSISKLSIEIIELYFAS